MEFTYLKAITLSATDQYDKIIIDIVEKVIDKKDGVYWFDDVIHINFGINLLVNLMPNNKPEKDDRQITIVVNDTYDIINEKSAIDFLLMVVDNEIMHLSELPAMDNFCSK